MSERAAPRSDAFWSQVQRAISADLMRRPLEQLAAFVRAVRVHNACLDAAATGAPVPPLEARFWRAIDELEPVARAAWPALARAEGVVFRSRLVAMVMYVALSEHGDEEGAHEMLELLTPRQLPAQPDPHELLRLAGLKVSGRRPGYARWHLDKFGAPGASDGARLRAVIRQVSDELDKETRPITAEAIAAGLGVDVTNLRRWTRQLEVGGLREIVKAERDRHGRRLERKPRD